MDIFFQKGKKETSLEFELYSIIVTFGYGLCWDDAVMIFDIKKSPLPSIVPSDTHRGQAHAFVSCMSSPQRLWTNLAPQLCHSIPYFFLGPFGE